MRNGLKALMRQVLNREVQVETAEQRGHDSAEDARAAGELVRFRVMAEWEKLRALGWRVEGTRFLRPGEEVEGEGRGSLSEEFIERGRGVGGNGPDGGDGGDGANGRAGSTRTNQRRD